jgi:hypothetical protein
MSRSFERRSIVHTSFAVQFKVLQEECRSAWVCHRLSVAGIVERVPAGTKLACRFLPDYNVSDLLVTHRFLSRAAGRGQLTDTDIAGMLLRGAGQDTVDRAATDPARARRQRPL